MEAAFAASQEMMDAKPAIDENSNQLMVTWFDLVQRFQMQHQEIMEMLKAKQTEFYAHYDPFQQWAEEH